MKWLDRFGLRLRTAPPLLVDAALVLLLTGLAVAEALNPWNEGGRSPDALIVALVVLTTAPLLWRRRQPELVLGIALAAWTLAGWLGYGGINFQTLGTLVALYGVAVERDRRRSLIALAASMACTVARLGLDARWLDEPLRVQDWALAFVLPAMAWGVGTAHRRLRESAHTQEVLTRRLQQEQALSQRRAVLEERNRIARELHDVVAHHISTIAMQANAARTMLPGRPEQADAGLAFIHTSSRDALAEMRRLIGILKGTDTDDLRAPRPTLADLDKIVARANEANLATELEIRGRPRPLPAVLELSAYRIVQEALTNAIKHAGPASAQVLVHYHPDRLDLTVTNTGGSPPVPPSDLADVRHASINGSGLGLLGMRERVALFGGTLDAGPSPDGGFHVSATLPVPAGTSPTPGDAP